MTRTRGGSRMLHTAARAKAVAQAAYASPEPAPYSSPPSEGPAMLAHWNTEDENAAARG